MTVSDEGVGPLESTLEVIGYFCLAVRSRWSSSRGQV